MNNPNTYTPTSIDDNFVTFNNIPVGYEYDVNVVDNTGTYSQVSTPRILVTSDYEEVDVTMQEKEAYYNDTLSVLNNIDDSQDTYDGLGGTEEEVNEILDEILGN